MYLKNKLLSGQKVVGTMLTMVYNPNMIWVLKNAGLDYIFIDCEHGTFSFEQVSNLTSICRALKMGVIVRTPATDKQNIQKLSDMGIDGIMVPMVEDARQMEEANYYARYKPLGNRGMTLGAIVDFDTRVDLVKTINDINDEFIIIAQIETMKGVAEIENILSVKGVDAIMFGIYDMTISYGMPGQISIL